MCRFDLLLPQAILCTAPFCPACWPVQSERPFPVHVEWLHTFLIGRPRHIQVYYSIIYTEMCMLCFTGDGSCGAGGDFGGTAADGEVFGRPHHHDCRGWRGRHRPGRASGRSHRPPEQAVRRSLACDNWSRFFLDVFLCRVPCALKAHAASHSDSLIASSRLRSTESPAQQDLTMIGGSNSLRGVQEPTSVGAPQRGTVRVTASA